MRPTLTVGCVIPERLERRSLRASGVVDARQDTGCGYQRINPRLGRCRMPWRPRTVTSRCRQPLCAVVTAYENPRNRIVGATQALGEQPARPDIPTDLFVIGEMQLDAAVERSPTSGEFLQRAERVCVGREVGLAHGNSTAVHGWSLRRVVYYIRAVRILRPSQTGRYHVAVRIECMHGPSLPKRCRTMRLVAEIMPAARTESTGTGWASTVNPNAFQQGSGPLSMRRAITGRIVRRDFASAARKSHSAAKLSSTILPTAVSRADLPGGVCRESFRCAQVVNGKFNRKSWKT